MTSRDHARKTSKPIKITSRSRRDWDSFRSLRIRCANFRTNDSDQNFAASFYWIFRPRSLLKFFQFFVEYFFLIYHTKYIYNIYNMKLNLGGLNTKKERFNFTSIILATPSHSRQHLRRVITSATVVMFPNVVSRASSALPSKELPRVGTIHPPGDSFSKCRLQTPVIDVSKPVQSSSLRGDSVQINRVNSHGRMCDGRVSKRNSKTKN